MVGDAALRTGHYRTATDVLRDGAGSGWESGVRERRGDRAGMGGAGARPARGRVPAPGDGVAETTPACDRITEVALALVGAASGSPESAATLAELAARPDADPAFRQMAPFLEAYARYWSGDLSRRRGCLHRVRGRASRQPIHRRRALRGGDRRSRGAGRDAEAQADLRGARRGRQEPGRLSSAPDGSSTGARCCGRGCAATAHCRPADAATGRRPARRGRRPSGPAALEQRSAQGARRWRRAPAPDHDRPAHARSRPADAARRSRRQRRACRSRRRPRRRRSARRHGVTPPPRAVSSGAQGSRPFRGPRRRGGLAAARAAGGSACWRARTAPRAPDAGAERSAAPRPWRQPDLQHDHRRHQ